MINPSPKGILDKIAYIRGIVKMQMELHLEGVKELEKSRVLYDKFRIYLRNISALFVKCTIPSSLAELKFSRDKEDGKKQ